MIPKYNHLCMVGSVALGFDVIWFDVLGSVAIC